VITVRERKRERERERERERDREKERQRERERETERQPIDVIRSCRSHIPIKKKPVIVFTQ
jgi:hypothetical protein